MNAFGMNERPKGVSKINNVICVVVSQGSRSKRFCRFNHIELDYIEYEQ